MLEASAVVEAADGLDRHILCDYVRAQRRAWPAGGAALRDDPLGLAAVDGCGRESRVALHAAASARDLDAGALDRLLAWHAETRAAAAEPTAQARCRLILPPEPSPTLRRALAARGFAYRSHALVLVRPLRGLRSSPQTRPISDATPEQRALASRTIARGYLDGADPRPSDLRAAETWFDLPGATHALAWADGHAIGGGAVIVHGAHALLGQMAVLPGHRGRGVQSALIAHRLRLAAARGATLAFATCAPHGPSLRNLRRAGFTFSHARISLAGRPREPVDGGRRVGDDAGR